ncbi:protein singed wings 2 isoform X2 [Galleria mellonella]|uniref:Protein singed wings 2 isoform X2 n=1 Tax=Galleria mellonella TaxID=7137 RepID=A0ABM3M8A5_GALME|nr:protein singed wings 2 isoform X2 [Galleria mellonella]
MKVIERLLLLSFVTAVTPGPHYRRRNNSDYLVNKLCSVREHIRGHCEPTHFKLTCRKGFADEWLNGIKHEISHLHVIEWPGKCLNVGQIQEHFPNLKSLEIINSTVLHSFKENFKATSKIENLTVHGLTSLWEIPPEIVENMKELRIIDLRGNMLRHIKAGLLRGPKLQRVYLSDNKWDCSDGGLDWLAMERDNNTLRKRIIDYYDLMCHQQLYRGKPLHKVMDIIWINTIRSIIQNREYQKLADLYLDNNSISAVKELEGSEWFTTFRVLSLRGNMLKQIPVYAFDKAFQANNNIMHVFLGRNPWRCDCHFIPRFQSLLLKYKRVIRDLADIRCSKSSDKTTSLMQISTMPLGHVCSNNDIEMPISPINIVNLVLFGLILLIMGRFFYDWHNFKTTGKLPWLSSILP